MKVYGAGLRLWLLIVLPRAGVDTPSGRGLPKCSAPIEMSECVSRAARLPRRASPAPRVSRAARLPRRACLSALFLVLICTSGCCPRGTSAPGETFSAGYIFPDKQSYVMHDFIVRNTTPEPVKILR